MPSAPHDAAMRAALSELVARGTTVAVGDGAGLAVSALGPLSDCARVVGDVRLVLGWCPVPLTGVQLDAFADVVTIMGGYGLRTAIDTGEVRYLPVRLGAVPALLHDVLRPDVLVASLVRRRDGWCFATEISWMRAAVDAGAIVAAVECPAFPSAAGGPAVPEDRVVRIGSNPAPPPSVEWGAVSSVHRSVAAHVMPFVPEGSRLQFGPGVVGTAVIEALTHPVSIDTGIITDAVAALDRRGLLTSPPIAPYLAGTIELYRWADGRGILAPIEVTHDLARLASGPPLVAVNTALEIDIDGQVNVEAVGGSVIAGIGGHPDFACAAACAPGGASIVAVPSSHRDCPTLVAQLSGPVSTPSHDVDVVVTERGSADLRGLDRHERRQALRELWRCP